MPLHNILKPIWTDRFISLSNSGEQEIKKEYKIIRVDWLHPKLVKLEMEKEKYSDISIDKELMIENMLDYYLNHTDKSIYKKTDYLCNKTEKVCICNTHAQDLRKIYDGIHYDPGEKFISWFYSK